MGKLDNYKSVLDEAKKVDDTGFEFWDARVLQEALGYKSWSTFERVINKAIISCNKNGIKAKKHFVEIDGISKRGGKEILICDYKLSRYACHLIMQNIDLDNEFVLFAKEYFMI